MTQQPLPLLLHRVLNKEMKKEEKKEECAMRTVVQTREEEEEEEVRKKATRACLVQQLMEVEEVEDKQRLRVGQT